MKYNGLIGVNQDFQTSVNLEYDLNKTGKVQSYIPTEQSVKVLGAFLRSYYFNAESQNRATVLIGPYGRGKSHLLLVLSALTSLDLRAHSAKERKKANEIQMELCEKIERVDKEVGALAKAIAIFNIIGDERLKPVPAHIKAALLMDDKDFDKSTSELLRKHILSQRDSSEFVLLTANGVDVQRSVDNYVKTSLSRINVCETLSRAD